MLGFGALADAPTAAEAFGVVIVAPPATGSDLAALEARVALLETRLNAVLAAGVLVYENGRWKVYN